MLQKGMSRPVVDGGCRRGLVCRLESLSLVCMVKECVGDIAERFETSWLSKDHGE